MPRCYTRRCTASTIITGIGSQWRFRRAIPNGLPSMTGWRGPLPMPLFLEACPRAQTFPTSPSEPLTRPASVACGKKVQVGLFRPFQILVQGDEQGFAPHRREKKYLVPGGLQGDRHRAWLRLEIFENDVAGELSR